MPGDTASEPMVAPLRTWTLLDRQGRPYPSGRPGAFGGYRPRRIYGRLDCPSALRAIARGGYVRHRVFFADEATAIAAGYRPCAICLPVAYAAWRRQHPAIPVRSVPQRKPSTG